MEQQAHGLTHSLYRMETGKVWHIMVQGTAVGMIPTIRTILTIESGTVVFAFLETFNTWKKGHIGGVCRWE